MVNRIYFATGLIWIKFELNRAIQSKFIESTSSNPEKNDNEQKQLQTTNDRNQKKLSLISFGSQVDQQLNSPHENSNVNNRRDKKNSREFTRK